MDKLDPALIWFLVGLALTLLEFVVPGVLLIFFAFGAWIVSITTYLNVTDTAMVQILTFTGTSLLLLLGLREWFKGKLYGHVTGAQDLEKNLDDLTGKEVEVIKDIAPGRSGGAVELKGAVWTVNAEESFQKGEVAIIDGVDGIVLKIKKKAEV